MHGYSWRLLHCGRILNSFWPIRRLSPTMQSLVVAIIWARKNGKSIDENVQKLRDSEPSVLLLLCRLLCLRWACSLANDTCSICKCWKTGSVDVNWYWREWIFLQSDDSILSWLYGGILFIFELWFLFLPCLLAKFWDFDMESYMLTWKNNGSVPYENLDFIYFVK